jgi:hypothetical protein
MPIPFPSLPERLRQPVARLRRRATARQVRRQFRARIDPVSRGSPREPSFFNKAKRLANGHGTALLNMAYPGVFRATEYGQETMPAGRFVLAAIDL